MSEYLKTHPSTRSPRHPPWCRCRCPGSAGASVRLLSPSPGRWWTWHPDCKHFRAHRYSQRAQIRNATQTLATLDGTIRGWLLLTSVTTLCYAGLVRGLGHDVNSGGSLQLSATPTLVTVLVVLDHKNTLSKLNLERVADSYQFSISSLTALAGRWITSPAAMRLTTVSSSLRMTPAMFTAPSSPCQGSSTAISDSECT